MKKIIFLILTSIIFYNFSCDNDPCPSVPSNSASIQMDLKPENKVYQIGDTIWISDRFDTDFELDNNPVNLNLINGSGRIGLLFMHLDQTIDVTRGFSDFEIINTNGEVNQDLINDEVARNYNAYLNFNCDETNCEFQIGIVTKTAGIFGIGIQNGNLIVETPGACAPNNKITNNRFNTSNFNKEILTENRIHDSVRLPGAGTSGWPLDDKSVFIFEVQ